MQWKLVGMDWSWFVADGQTMCVLEWDVEMVLGYWIMKLARMVNMVVGFPGGKVEVWCVSFQLEVWEWGMSLGFKGGVTLGGELGLWRDEGWGLRVKLRWCRMEVGFKETSLGEACGAGFQYDFQWNWGRLLRIGRRG